MWNFQYIEHTADLGIKIEADNIEELMIGALYVMFENLVELSKLEEQKVKKIKVKGKTKEELLFNLLKKALEDFYINGIVFKRVKKIKIKSEVLKLKFYAGIIDDNSSKDIFKHEIKTVTYHNLKIEKKDNRWTTFLIFDI
jgi:SHS2 domain-containing protein